MAFRADDMQAAHRHDAVVLRIRDLFMLFVGFVVGLARGKHVRIIRLGMARRFLDEGLVKAVLAQFAPRKEFRVAAEQNVRAAARHVRGDGHVAEFARLRNDLRLLGVHLRVEHLMPDAAAGKHRAHKLTLFHGNRAHKNRLARFVDAHDFVHHGLELARLRRVDHVVIILARKGLVGWDLHNVKIVDGLELRLLGLCRARHASKLLEHAEIILKRDCCKRFVLALHLHVFLGFKRLM